MDEDDAFEFRNLLLLGGEISHLNELKKEIEKK